MITLNYAIHLKVCQSYYEWKVETCSYTLSGVVPTCSSKGLTQNFCHWKLILPLLREFNCIVFDPKITSFYKIVFYVRKQKQSDFNK